MAVFVPKWTEAPNEPSEPHRRDEERTAPHGNDAILYEYLSPMTRQTIRGRITRQCVSLKHSCPWRLRSLNYGQSTHSPGSSADLHSGVSEQDKATRYLYPGRRSFQPNP